MGSRPSQFPLTQPGTLRMLSTLEMMALPAPTWLVEGAIPAGGLVGLYGPPGVMKSFVAADIALSVAAGGQWQGRAVQQGYPLYVCAEGGAGMGKRIKGWLHYRGLDAANVQSAWLTEAVPVYADSSGMDRVIARIEEADIVPDLIVIDTLARCFDGDENQQEDMGRFVAGVDRLRKEFDTTVLVVHHTRLDGDRERGNTAFRGAADTMLSLGFKKGKLTLACMKQKDAEEFDDIELRVKAIPEADTVVIASTLGAPTAEGKKAKYAMMLQALERLNTLNTPVSWDVFREACEADGISRASFARYVRDLIDTKQIAKENGEYERI